MRTIKFRGLKSNGIWCYGCGVGLESILYMHPDKNGKIAYSKQSVFRKTIGQFTGFKDKDGEDIYEGDKVKYNGTIGEVVYKMGGFILEYQDKKFYYFGDMVTKSLEVIGNIYILNNKKI